MAGSWTQRARSDQQLRDHRGRPGGYYIDLDSNETDTGNDFGNWRIATKSGMKFEDLDADGVQDDGEPGVGA